MLFNDFKKDERCGDCGKLLSDLASGEATCRPCQDEVDYLLARTTVLGHLKTALYCFWSFDFIGALVELIWAVQRATGTGDYGENGRFTKLLNQRASK
jgi:hypothetical protein